MSQELEKRKAGRPSNSLNKVSKAMKDILTTQLNHAVCHIGKYIEEIKDPKEKIDAIVKVLPYIMPKVTDNPLLDGRNSIIIQYLPPQDAEVIE